MKKIIAFAGSNSSTSINYQLVKYATTLIKGFDCHLLNMVDYPLPLYSEDLEKEKGFSNSLVEMKNDVADAAGLIIGVNEHNGNPSAYFKNLIDWFSRLDRKFLEGQNVLLLGTSPGKGGAKNALEVTKNMLPHMGATIVDIFSLPSFYTNFSSEEVCITDEQINSEFKLLLHKFVAKIS